MKKLSIILCGALIGVLAAWGQTTYVLASRQDVDSGAVSVADRVLASDWYGELRMWTPFPRSTALTTDYSATRASVTNVNNVTWDSGVAVFNGSSNYLVMPGIAATGITVCAWVRADSSSTHRWFLGEGDANNNLVGFLLGIAGNGNLSLSVSHDGEHRDTYSCSGSFPVSEWIYVVATWDGTDDGGVAIRTNGVAAATTQVSDGGDTSGGPQAMTPLRIGSAKSVGGSERFYDGKLDDVRVYGRVLSVAEQDAIYAEGRR